MDFSYDPNFEVFRHRARNLEGGPNSDPPPRDTTYGDCVRRPGQSPPSSGTSDTTKIEFYTESSIELFLGRTRYAECTEVTVNRKPALSPPATKTVSDFTYSSQDWQPPNKQDFDSKTSSRTPRSQSRQSSRSLEEADAQKDADPTSKSSKIMAEKFVVSMAMRKVGSEK